MDDLMTFHVLSHHYKIFLKHKSKFHVPWNVSFFFSYKQCYWKMLKEKVVIMDCSHKDISESILK